MKDKMEKEQANYWTEKHVRVFVWLVAYLDSMTDYTHEIPHSVHADANDGDVIGSFWIVCHSDVFVHVAIH